MSATATANEPAENERLAASLATDLEALPDVERASVKWQDRFEVPETLSVTVGVAPGADFGPVIDEITRLAWTSEIHPLSTVSIYVRDVNDVNRNQSEGVFLDEPATAEELGQKYGPRPG